jgi:hypothetical protein
MLIVGGGGGGNKPNTGQTTGGGGGGGGDVQDITATFSPGFYDITTGLWGTGATSPGHGNAGGDSKVVQTSSPFTINKTAHGGKSTSSAINVGNSSGNSIAANVAGCAWASGGAGAGGTYSAPDGAYGNAFGGPGIMSDITGSSIEYGSGGGGGAGGLLTSAGTTTCSPGTGYNPGGGGSGDPGGGAGSNFVSTQMVAQTDGSSPVSGNNGSGGGGGASGNVTNSNGYRGSDGVVILKYTKVWS